MPAASHEAISLIRLSGPAQPLATDACVRASVARYLSGAGTVGAEELVGDARPPRRPAAGATQNSQSCSSAQPPTNSAGPVLRAGFTEVLVTGMLIRWIRVRHRPMAIGAKPAGALPWVAPRMMNRKHEGHHDLATKPAASE